MRHEAILRELERLYPDARPQLDFSNPYETLVATILSAQCTDARVNQVTPAVFERFPTVEAMAQTDPEILYPMVRSCGFKSKAENIVNACRMIVSEFSGQMPSTMEELTRLPGVGRKTANVVLAFAFGQDAIPVDTHVFRVANRLGIARADTPEKVERQLMEAFPKNTWSRAHHWLIYHGRRVCHSQRPDCVSCTLKPWCAFYNGDLSCDRKASDRSGRKADKHGS